MGLGVYFLRFDYFVISFGVFVCEALGWGFDFFTVWIDVGVLFCFGAGSLLYIACVLVMLDGL